MKNAKPVTVPFSDEKKKEEEESTPELTPTSEKADFFISDEDDWYNIT